MSNPSVTNVDGTNPGPNSASLPDTVQAPVGNIWKIGSFSLALQPASVATATIVEQTFTMTGLLTTDLIEVSMQTPVAMVAIVNSRCSAAGVLALSFLNLSSTTTGAAASLSQSYNVGVMRVQPNWTAPASGALMDW